MLGTQKAQTLHEKNVNMEKTDYSAQLLKFETNIEAKFIRLINLFNGSLTGYYALTPDLFENGRNIEVLQKTLKLTCGILNKIPTIAAQNPTLNLIQMNNLIINEGNITGAVNTVLPITTGHISFFERLKQIPELMMLYIRCWFVIGHLIKRKFMQETDMRDLFGYGNAIFRHLVDWLKYNPSYDWQIHERFIKSFQFADVQKTVLGTGNQVQKVERWDINALVYDKGDLYPIKGSTSNAGYVIVNFIDTLNNPPQDLKITIPNGIISKTFFNKIMMVNTPYPNEWKSLCNQIYERVGYDEHILGTEFRKVGEVRQLYRKTGVAVTPAELQLMLNPLDVAHTRLLAARVGVVEHPGIAQHGEAPNIIPAIDPIPVNAMVKAMADEKIKELIPQLGWSRQDAMRYIALARV